MSKTSLRRLPKNRAAYQRKSGVRRHRVASHIWARWSFKKRQQYLLRKSYLREMKADNIRLLKRLPYFRAKKVPPRPGLMHTRLLPRAFTSLHQVYYRSMAVSYKAISEWLFLLTGKSKYVSRIVRWVSWPGQVRVSSKPLLQFASYVTEKRAFDADNALAAYNLGAGKRSNHAKIIRISAVIRGLPRRLIASAGQDLQWPLRAHYARVIVKHRYAWFLNKHLVRIKWYRKRLRRWYARYRKIKKNIAFVTLFRRHFRLLTGVSEQVFLRAWVKFRRGSNKFWGPVNLMQKFSQTILLRPASLALLLALAPSRAAAESLISSGAFVVNGTPTTRFGTFIKPGDIVQLNIKSWELTRLLYIGQRWRSGLRLQIAQLPFLHVDWALIMFIVVRWPLKHELVAPSFLSEKWIRYYIRGFPIKLKQYRLPSLGRQVKLKLVHGENF